MKAVIDRLAPLFVLALFAVLVLTVVRSSIFENISPEKHIYFEIVFLLLLAVLGELAVIYFRQPSVMILLLVGVILSPGALAMLWAPLSSALTSLGFAVSSTAPIILRDEAIIHVFAQLGAIVLLFKVGLHNKMEDVFCGDNLLVGAMGVLLPFAAGFLFATYSGGDFAYAMFLGAALTATSVGVTVALLKEFGLLKEKFAQVIIGAAVIDDVLGLLVLSFVINVSGGGISIPALLITFVTAVIFLFGSIVFGNYFVSYLDRKDMSPRRFLLVLAVMLFYAYIAEFIQLSAIVGAFLAGVVLNRSRHVGELEGKTYGLEMLFMPIFFISLGMLVDINALYAFLVPICLLTLIAAATKVIACGAGALMARLPGRDALAVGLGMVPRGEVALIVGSIGLTTGVLGSAQYSIITAMALLTTFIVPPLLGMVLEKKK